ncbi:MAG: cytochrome b [Ignavibacteriales bacterium]
MNSPPHRYSYVAMLLHWAIAALIIANVLIAWNAEDLKGQAHALALQPHKTIGITVLILSVLRLLWRLVMKPPRMPDTLAPWERLLANTVHTLFYVLIVALPLSGWAMASVGKLATVYPIHLGPLIVPVIAPLNHLPPAQAHTARETLETAHGLMAQAIVYVLLPLHIAGALKHQFWDKADEFGRMIPFWPRRRAEGHAP